MTDTDATGRHPARRVLIIGDSNCLPRPPGKYADSWIYLLKQAMPQVDFVILADGSRTTEYLAIYPRRRPDGTLEYDPANLEIYEPRIVICNLGIVDCAPRLFTKFESRFLSTIPTQLRTVLIAATKRIRRRTSLRAYVRLPAFEHNVRQYLARCRASGVGKVILIGIPTPDIRGTRRNPTIREAVAQYNAVLAGFSRQDERVVFIDPLQPEQDVSRLYVDDGYHLSIAGHRRLYCALAKVLGLESA